MFFMHYGAIALSLLSGISVLGAPINRRSPESRERSSADPTSLAPQYTNHQRDWETMDITKRGAAQSTGLEDMLDKPGVEEVQMDEDTIKKALEEVAKILSKKKEDITIIAVGGAVNTVVLHTRPSTGDVDFFSDSKRSSPTLKKAIETVEKDKKFKVGKGWLNNHTVLFMDDAMIKALFDEAVQQNVKLVDKPGLKVLAAPWRYSVMAKLEKVGKGPGVSKSYDITDAVAYLHEAIEKRPGKTPVKKSEIQAWATEFKVTVKEENIVKLAEEYKVKYPGKDGIVN